LSHSSAFPAKSNLEETPGQNVTAILQARMGSKRLPGKVLAPILGEPMLRVTLRRLESAQRITKLLLATSTHSADDPIAALADQAGIECYRGSEDDCLDRYYWAAMSANADVVVRLTGDNPLVDGAFVDEVIARYIDSTPAADYVNPELSGCFPVGLKAEVFSLGTLGTVWREAKSSEDREHVTPFIYHHPDRFRIESLSHSPAYGHLHWTVDTQSDLDYVRLTFEHFGSLIFPWQSVTDAIYLGLIPCR
jgi:spore coat polysaccharide biosynthesis protein SpsF